MNGLIASTTHPLIRRFVRAVFLLACCVLSVSLLGAAHTRPLDARAIRQGSDSQPNAGPVLAEFRSPRTERTLTATVPGTIAVMPTPATDELLHDANPSVARASAGSIAATMLSQVEALLTMPAFLPPAATPPAAP